MKPEPTKPQPLTQRITLECTLDDLSWIMRMIGQARENYKLDGGTPLHGGSASVLICALARTRTVRSTLTEAEAKAQRMGGPAK